MPALKAGVIGGSFNNAGFDVADHRRLQHQRQPLATRTVIYVDGAVAIRTRSAGAIIGVQNADTVQEVQVLTANYMPEYGRASGGQIRFISKSGSNRYSGNASFFLRDETLQANTWARNRSRGRGRELRPGAVRLQAVRLLVRRPDPGEMFKDKLFFFGAQEWVDFFQVADQHRHGADRGDAARRLQRAARVRIRSSARPQIIRDPLTGQPFPGNIIPPDRLSPNGIAIDEPVSRCRRRASSRARPTRSSTATTRRISGRTASGFDYRLNNNNQISYRFQRSNWVAIDAFRGDLPVRPHRLGAAESRRRTSTGRARSPTT